MIGKVAALKRDTSTLVEIQKISENDIATVEMCRGGAVFDIRVDELEDIEAVQPHRVSGGKVHILGTEYTIIIVEERDYRFYGGCDGATDPSVKEILLLNNIQDCDAMRDLDRCQKVSLRHEIIHAFLYESGLWQNSLCITSWAKNEEMVDWIAIQAPKIAAAFKEAGCDEE